MIDILDRFSLKGKKAIVTGAARGLGFGIAEGFCSAGADVVLLDVLDTVKESAQKIAITSKTNVYGVKGNIGIKGSRNTAFNEAITLLGGNVDILVNGAGVQHRCEAIDFMQKEWEKIIRINLSSTFYMCQLAGQVMLKKSYGRIINIASMMSFFGGVMISAYAASKGGVSQLTKSLSNEWSGKGVNVNAIAPGFMKTELTATLQTYPEQIEEITKRIPMGRWGNADDIKGITVFLASDASDYLSGAIIPIDGGYLHR